MQENRRALDPHGKLWSVTYATVRLGVYKKPESSCEGRPDTVATGFLFFKSIHGDKGRTYLVTNRHVVKDGGSATFSMTRKSGDKPVVGKGLMCGIDDLQRAFFCHPDPGVDVAVCDLTPQFCDPRFRESVYFQYVDSRCCATDEMLSTKFDALEDVVVVGYPGRLWDQHNLQPVLRKGSTATAPWLDFDGKPMFLIDAPVFQGSSGSPVFLYDSGLVITEKLEVRYQRVYFLGVLGGFYCRSNRVEVEIKDEENDQPKKVKMELPEKLYLGGVYKTRAILETIRAHEQRRSSADNREIECQTDPE